MRQIPQKYYSDYIDSRIRDIESACQRSRWTYVALITVSWLLLAMAYNSTFSFARGIADYAKLRSDCKPHIDLRRAPPEKIEPGYEACLEIWKALYADIQEREQRQRQDAGVEKLAATGRAAAMPATEAPAVPPTKDELARADADGSLSAGSGNLNPTTWMQYNFLRDWTGSLFFEIPVVGGRFSAVDVGAIGGVALMLITIWGFFSVRRENHLIYYLVRDAQEWRWPVEALAYLRIQLAATQIFASGWHDQPLGGAALRQRFGAGEKVLKSSNKIMRALAFAMLCLPVVALLVVLVTDLYTLFIVSPMRDGRRSLLDVITASCHRDLQSCADFWKIMLRIGITSLFLLAQLWGSSRMMAFQVATSEILEFTKRWKMKAPVSISLPGRLSQLRQMLAEVGTVSDVRARADKVRRAFIEVHGIWDQIAAEAVNPHPAKKPVPLSHVEYTALNHGWSSSAVLVEQSAWLSPLAMPPLETLKTAVHDLEEWCRRRGTATASAVDEGEADAADG